MIDTEIKETLEQAQRCVVNGNWFGHTMKYASHVSFLLGEIERLEQKLAEANDNRGRWDTEL